MVQMRPGLRLADGVITADLGRGGVLLDTARPVAAFIAPTAMAWLQGKEPAAEDHAAYRQCLKRWSAAGLIHVGNTQPALTPAPTRMRAQADDVAVPHRVLVVAMSSECGFCTQLSADLAANASVMTRLNTSVLLLEDVRDDLLGLPVPPQVRARLVALGRKTAHLGTPSGWLLSPGSPARFVVGFPEVSAELVQLSGGNAVTTVIEAPTSCSLKVAEAPVDALVTARVDGGRAVGVAVRGSNDILELVRSVTGEGYQDVYTPVTLTVERPQSLYLLYRGGELLTRARTADALRHALAQVLTGYGVPNPSETTLLCAAAVHRAGRAALLPRNWLSDLVVHSTRLERAGWRLCPRPFTTLRLPPSGGRPVLTGSPSDRERGIPVNSILSQSASTGSWTRAQLLAQIVNWVHRPAMPDSVCSLANTLQTLPVHVGTWRQALDHLLADSPVT
ncbi:hypothetical protein ACWGF2_31400 [Streptomyces sp. NPDC054919]